MKPVILVIMDGYGLSTPNPGNAVYLANPPVITRLMNEYPHTTLKASGESVGLPPGEVGNTEVGHINIGAGRVVYQDLSRINMSITDGSFYANQALLKAVAFLQKTGGKLHVIGLVSEGCVHSSLDHLSAVLHFARENKVSRVLLHAITDGRDSAPNAGREVVKKVEDQMKKGNLGEIATVTGRYYAMDRDRRWDRVEKAYKCMTEGIGKQAASVDEAITQSYDAGVTDEFIEPTNIVKDGKPVGLVEEGDAVIFFNFRIDRPRELTKAFVLNDFETVANIGGSYNPHGVVAPFTRTKKIDNLCYVTMTEYEVNLPVEVAFPPFTVQKPLGEVIAEHKFPQLHMSESEKERFVTFYFNGLHEEPYPLEERVIIHSPKVPTYDMMPEMSADELVSVVVQKLSEEKFSFVVVNFANPDMVGHTGNIEATIKAVKTVDTCVGQIVEAALQHGYTLFITADHGNAEQKINPQNGQISTEHTGNPVPFIAVSSSLKNRGVTLLPGILADIAPTVLGELGIPKPQEMTGRNLLEHVES
ncbi:2,3-bisphosphoglycerate-independent phosphoglycerate mutase [Candidatus Roizmanbacteria bacterium]|nr:2,3-bisphosphoglycerate-independent phosphoglycerate mutase [Candidatus Roizmanbacteria bacterium]